MYTTAIILAKPPGVAEIPIIHRFIQFGVIRSDYFQYFHKMSFQPFQSSPIAKKKKTKPKLASVCVSLDVILSEKFTSGDIDHTTEPYME